ncbi:hypothetical protein K1719_017325 [Acacia pycnantha]|nr:hypothetical protein K1719_017325 [Acacia pycnantha]
MRKQKQQQGKQEESQKKERHIVTWTQEEDDTLRKQISIHGTENWAIIASNFKDKTTRQCRRRWYTYLNSDFKKGGWSPEEDLLLCEAQKIFGNRWTEIAKVVSGRTDNAVKNRFSTLCKKRAKFEALAKENNTSFINSNNKRTIFQQGDNRESTSEAAPPAKKMRRAHIPDAAEKINYGDRSHKHYEATIKQQPRAPFSILAQNLPHEAFDDKISRNAHNSKTQGTFLKEDDPKISMLMQQAELLSSLTLKVNTDDVDQSLEDAWKVLQEFLNQTKESDILKYKISDLQLVDLKYMMEEFKSSNEGCQQCWRQPELYEDSPSSSEYSTGSTLLPHSASDNLEHSLLQDIGTDLKPIQLGDQKVVSECGKEDLSSATVGQVADAFPSCEEQISNDGIASTSSSTEFNSPLQVTPLFRSLAAGIPSPQFSESERNFLMRTLGLESPSMNPSANPSQPPPCKRALLNSL